MNRSSLDNGYESGAPGNLAASTVSPSSASGLHNGEELIDQVREEELSVGHAHAHRPKEETTTDPNEEHASAGEEHRLEALFLQGRISKEELLHKLRVHNTLVAEQVVKDGRESMVQVVDMREVPQPSMANPEKAVAPPPPGGYAKEKNDKIFVSSGDNSEDREQQDQKKEQEEKKQEDQRNDAWMAIRFTEIDSETVEAHAEVTEEELMEELEAIRGKSNSLNEENGLESLERSQGATETIRKELDHKTSHAQSMRPPRTPVEATASSDLEGLEAGPALAER